MRTGAEERLEKVLAWLDEQMAEYHDSRAVPDHLVELALILSRDPRDDDRMRSRFSPELNHSLNDVTTIGVIAERPKDVPPGWLILNAPRPLLGHREWQGEFVHGIFYVAIDPQDTLASTFLQKSHDLDGWLIRYYSEKDVRKLAYQWAEREYPDVVSNGKIIDDSVDEKMIVDTFMHHFGEKQRYKDLSEEHRAYVTGESEETAIAIPCGQHEEIDHSVACPSR